MVALISFIGIVAFSLLVVRMGTVALELTGLSEDVASFQAQSAFSGVGFTTSESEYIVRHPVRRKILRILILLGSAGLTSAITTLLLTFIGKSGKDVIIRLVLIFSGIFALIVFSYSKWLNRMMNRVIERFLKKWTKLHLTDYEHLFGLSRGFTIAEFEVKRKSWLANRKLKDLKLRLEGVLILGIYRKVNRTEEYLGAPWGETLILPGDRLICYGKEETIQTLAKRLKGREGAKQHIEIAKKVAEIKKVAHTI